MNSTQTNPSGPPESDIEQLSAYLDNQLSVAERINIERRMEADPALRLELESLRETVGTLRGLEPVRPPRSFTLDPATVGRPRRVFPFAWLMQMGSGLAGLALVLVATVQMLAVGAVPAAAPMAAESSSMATKQAPATGQYAPTDAAVMSAPAAPAADARMAEPTAAPAATMAPAAEAPAPASGSAASAAEALATATPPLAAMVVPSPQPGSLGANSGGAAPPAGGAGGPPSIDQTADAIQSSESSSPGTAELPAPPPPAAAPARGIPPGLTLAVGVALLGVAGAWYFASRRA